MKPTFAGKIRQAIKELSKTNDSLTPWDISAYAELDCAEHTKMYPVLSDFCQSGELIRVRRGVYHYRPTRPERPSIQERMWRVLRSSRGKVVEIDDLVQMAGASEPYAREWLTMLVRQGIVRQLSNGKWQMTRDPVAMPRNEEKAKKLRELRNKKKAALKALERAKQLIETICI